MAILITGGRGKTSSRIASLCLSSQVPFLIASRNGNQNLPPNHPAVTFNWLDPSTFSNPFLHTFPGNEKITTVYLIAPEVAEPIESMGPFIDLAKERGVKKFVYFTGSSAELDGDIGESRVWKYLENSLVEYVVLRATWFMDNFLQWQHGATIKNENKIYSACNDGNIPFISANDIARVAFKVLSDDEKKWATSYRILGPELLTFDQIASKLSLVTNRTIEHIKISGSEACERYVKFGMPGHVARFLAEIEVGTAGGSEEFTGNDVENITGVEPESFDKWAWDNRAGFAEG